MGTHCSKKRSSAVSSYSGWIILISLQSILILLLSWRVAVLQHRYMALVTQTVIHQEKSGVRFRIIQGDPEQTVMLIGDIVGTNFFSAQVLSQVDPLPDYPGRKIIVSQIKPQLQKAISAGSLLTAMGDEKGIILSDNFCIQDWDQVKSKSIYQETTLSPGPYCFSEPATLIMDNLLKQYQVSKVVLYYDVPAYKQFLTTFATYLGENGIAYDLKDIKTVRGGTHAKE